MPPPMVYNTPEQPYDHEDDNVCMEVMMEVLQVPGGDPTIRWHSFAYCGLGLKFSALRNLILRGTYTFEGGTIARSVCLAFRVTDF